MREYTFDEMRVGLAESFEVEITEKMMENFRGITGDVNPLHMNQNYAREKGYPDCVVYGMLTTSFISTLAGVYLPGKYSLINKEEMMFKKTVIVGDRLTVRGEVIDRNEKFKYVVLKVRISNQNDDTVILGKMEIGVTS